MMTTYVVVADGSRARFLKSAGTLGALSEFEDMTNPAARLRTGEQLSDRAGRGYNSSSHTGHTMDFRCNLKHQEQLQFAKHVGDRLEQARTRGECDKMILVAAPTFLGLLRKELSPQTARMVTAEVDKDLVLEDLSSIRERLPYRI